MSRELNFNVMLSQHGILTLAHSHHELESLRRWANAIQVNDIDSELMTPEQIKKLVPLMNLEARFPVHGGFIQRRGGISRHDAVAWAMPEAPMHGDVFSPIEILRQATSNNAALLQQEGSSAAWRRTPMPI